eukprot:5024505-Lingulodinium_polyedra.AAC.1
MCIRDRHHASCSRAVQRQRQHEAGARGPPGPSRPRRAPQRPRYRTAASPLPRLRGEPLPSAAPSARGAVCAAVAAALL